MRLTSIDADGWPRAAHISSGEALAVDDRHVAFALWPASGAAANLARDPRASLSLVSDGAICELRLLVRRWAPVGDLALFYGELAGCRLDRAPYADVLRGIAFRLHDPPAVLARWREQISRLRTWAEGTS
jgi:flavin reductase (DIM6/NTAB) family NADH-FMN oxidoreductase RutF